MSKNKKDNIPDWDILATTGSFNMKVFYGLLLMIVVYILNIAITVITVMNTNENSLADIGGFFIIATIFSFILTIIAIIFGHKGLKEIKTTRQKGRFFAYGVLSAGYISSLTLGIVFLTMDVMFVLLYLE